MPLRVAAVLEACQWRCAAGSGAVGGREEIYVEEGNRTPVTRQPRGGGGRERRRWVGGGDGQGREAEEGNQTPFPKQPHHDRMEVPVSELNICQ